MFVSLGLDRRSPSVSLFRETTIEVSLNNFQQILR